MDIRKASLPEIFEFSAQKLADVYRPGRVAHLAIDWQTLYCDPALPINHGCDPVLSRLIKATQARADEFAQSLRPQAPTVWVYHDPVLKLTDLPEDYLPCSDPRIRARKLERIREAGLEICGRVDAQADMVVRKPYRDAFEETDLHQRLQERAIDTLLITGLFRHYSYNKQRSECVGQTVASALARGYNTFIVEDLSVNKMVETPENRLSAVRMTTGENAYGVAARDVLRLINP